MNLSLKRSFIFLFSFFMVCIIKAQEFQGKAYYFSKTPMDLGRWGAKMSEQQKKQIAERLKNRLEKTYVLAFNQVASTYKEEVKLDAISGATDSWGKNFTPGTQYKNIKTKAFIQNQEFYGKVFLVKDTLQTILWTMGTETKKIGAYTCFKATCLRPKFDLSWYNFSWGELRREVENKTDTIKKPDALHKAEQTPSDDMVEVVAWYTPQIPVSQGPSDYTGLPGLILEVSAGNTTLLCNKIVINPGEKDDLKIPTKGKEVTRREYKTIITDKMKEFRKNRSGRR
ncbi:GLPGLI family protein [Cognatitamlana onchidii]|uniref:GLPGLI family protein n=1 Tax=Cognatitamlana onchidii TaxID=2562860 RepID=UPI0010A5C28D|nr:GLPGLI family protein [Algibacter onchidii]